MDINQQLGQRIRQLRDARKLSLEALAERCGVSRSNISLIERGQSSPTATVLDKLSVGLGVSLASLFEVPAEAPSPLARRADQVLWTDPASGYQRRNLSPACASPLQMVEVVFPPGARVAYDTAERDGPVHQQVWLIDGEMEVTVGRRNSALLLPNNNRVLLQPFDLKILLAFKVQEKISKLSLIFKQE